MNKKILIIKTGYSETFVKQIGYTCSLGDVLRTTVLLHKFKDDNVTWLTDESAIPLLEYNKYIKKVMPWDLFSAVQLPLESFDEVINLEKVPALAALGNSITCTNRYGFAFNSYTGEAIAYNHAVEAIDIANNTDKKINNEIYWQALLYNVINQKWDGEEYKLDYIPTTKENDVIGLNYQVGSKFKDKAWDRLNWLKVAQGLDNTEYQPDYTNLYDYMDWINSCSIIITNDSLGLHLALAMKKKVIALFGPTNAKEIYMYNRGIKIQKESMNINDIMPKDIFNALKEI